MDNGSSTQALITINSANLIEMNINAEYGQTSNIKNTKLSSATTKMLLHLVPAFCGRLIISGLIRFSARPKIPFATVCLHKKMFTLHILWKR